MQLPVVQGKGVWKLHVPPHLCNVHVGATKLANKYATTVMVIHLKARLAAGKVW